MRRLIPFLLMLSAGCIGDIVDVTKTDHGGGGADAMGEADMAMPPVADPKFIPDIQKDLVGKGCSITGCHADTFPPLVVDTDDPAVLAMNYANVKAVAMMGEDSTLLTKCLAGSGVVHTGGTIFQSKDDPTYQTWLKWINNGHPEK